MKLEDFDKHNIYTVPDQYFDELPGRIKKKILDRNHRWRWQPDAMPAWKYAVPAMCMLLAIVYFGIRQNAKISSNPQQIIAQVDNSDILAYLENSGISTDEIIEGYQPAYLDSLPDNALPDQSLPLDDDEVKDILQEYRLDIK